MQWILTTQQLLGKAVRYADLKMFSNDMIKKFGVINNIVKWKNWSAKNVKVTVVEHGEWSITGPDLFPQLGLSLNKTKLNLKS